jgi:uncharacterized membrane protein
MYTEIVLILLGLLVWVWTYRSVKRISKQSSYSETMQGGAWAHWLMTRIITGMILGAVLILIGFFMLLGIIRFPNIVLP